MQGCQARFTRLLLLCCLSNWDWRAKREVIAVRYYYNKKIRSSCSYSCLCLLFFELLVMNHDKCAITAHGLMLYVIMSIDFNAILSP